MWPRYALLLLFVFAFSVNAEDFTLKKTHGKTSIAPALLRPWAALKNGDKVAIVAPSRGCDKATLEKTKELVSKMGFVPVVDAAIFGENTFGFANKDTVRAKLFHNAMTDPEIKAVFALRGGQGACDVVYLLEKEYDLKKWQSKPLIGFSDITALHCYLNSQGIPSVHGPVLCFNKEMDPAKLNGQQSMLEAKEFLCSPEKGCTYNKKNHGVEFSPLNAAAKNRKGPIDGVLSGGNLTGVATVTGTSSEVASNSILVLEDIGETPERVTRSLLQIQRALAGKQGQPKAIVFGSFISDSPNLNEVLESFARSVDYPVFRTDAIGHGARNIFLPLGVRARIDDEADVGLRIFSWNGRSGDGAPK